jgi:aldehyde dehydrogenase (NAD+)
MIIHKHSQDTGRFIPKQDFQKNHGGISILERLKLLNKLQHLIKENKKLFQDASFSDLGKSGIEFTVSEFIPILQELMLAQNKLDKWCKPKRVKKSLTYISATGFISYEPKGVVLIISPWNFPFMLSLGPVISALAAGNSIVLKPSEHSPKTSDALHHIINTYFDPAFISVELGDAETAKDLLKLPFNHIFFTGSPSIGKKVMEAASVNLASVTLELGGKSPVIIDKGTDITDTAAKIAAGKFLNCGQVCVAPDYVFVHHSEKEMFIKEFVQALQKLYYRNSSNLIQNDDYGRIINIRHFERIEALFNDAVEKGASVICGGESEKNKLFFAPTVITEASDDSRLMNEEIFGPLLPVIGYENEAEVIHFILSKPSPLSLYIFSENKRITDIFLKRIPSGNVSINEVMLQFVYPGLPFGGINNSGIGNSHGYYGFKAFSHERAILKQSRWLSYTRLFAPPYNNVKKRLIRLAENFP